MTSTWLAAKESLDSKQLIESEKQSDLPIFYLLLGLHNAQDMKLKILRY